MDQQSTRGRKPRKPAPVMVTSSPAEIAAWNRKVTQGATTKRLRLNAQRKDRQLAKSLKDTGQAPKFAKERRHRQHQHLQRDEHGAVCLTGKRYELEGVHPSSREMVLSGWVDGDDFGYTVQRKWLAGISAQRGF